MTAVHGSDPAGLFHRCIEQKIPLMLLTPASTVPLQPRLSMLLAIASREAFSETGISPELAADHRMALVGGIADGSVGLRLGVRLAQLLNDECSSGDRLDPSESVLQTSIGVTVGYPQEDTEFSRYRHLAA